MKAWLALPLLVACTSDPAQPPPPACGTPGLSNQLAVTQNQIVSLALSGGELYWLDLGGVGAVATDASAAGGEIVDATALGGTIATNNSTVYWADGVFPAGTVDSVSATGGSRTTIAATDEPIGIAIDATNLYWSTFGSSDNAVGTIVKQPLAGGAPTVLAQSLSTVGPIAIDATNVYWTDMFGSVASVPIAGGSVTTLVPAQYALPPSTILDDTPVGLAVADGNVYWVSTPLDGMSPSTIDSVSITGGAVTVLAHPATQALGIAVDDAFVYWGEVGPVMSGGGHGAPPIANQGSVSRVDRDVGGTPQVLATGATYPVGPVVGGNAMYYASGSSASTVYRIVM